MPMQPGSPQAQMPAREDALIRRIQELERDVREFKASVPASVAPWSARTDDGGLAAGTKITAGDPGGSRVELDSAGLRKYGIDGTTVQVDLTGDVAAFSGLITGSEIIAGTAGAARIELDATGLRQYAADGTTVLLDTADDTTIRARGNSTALGANAQQALTTGTGNTAVGADAQLHLATGANDTAVGAGAQMFLDVGIGNTAVGPQAQLHLISGHYNTAVGHWAQNAYGVETVSASYQTSIGPHAGQSSATQVDGITTIGDHATAGAANATSIGREARADHAGSIALGYQALTTQTNQVMVGPRDVEITDTTKGLVLVSPDATRMRFTVNDAGDLLVNGSAIGGGPAATEAVAGIVELATTAEAVTGTDTARAVTPAGVKAAIGAGAWTAPTLTNSWVNFGSGYQTAEYRKTANGDVELRGIVKLGLPNAAGAMFTLPSGFRPPAIDILANVPAGAGTVNINVNTTGAVWVTNYGGGGTNANVCLTGLYFSTL